MQNASGKEATLREERPLHATETSLPLVSIIMPAFNGEPYIGAAIRSVLAQSYARWELLILTTALPTERRRSQRPLKNPIPGFAYSAIQRTWARRRRATPRLCSGAGRMDRAAGLRRYMAYRQAGKAACSCIAR